MKYACPKCKSGLTIQKTFNHKIMISCDTCSLEDLLEYAKNIDEAYLDFLTKFDEGKIPDKKQMSLGLKADGIIRDEKEIKEMIGNNAPDELTKSVLYSKKDYISKFKKLKNPLPKLGSKVDELGLDGEISDYLQKIDIKRFYKFQEDAIKEIAYGSNVVIEAPTASGKTEAFLIPVLQKINDKIDNHGKVLALFVYPTKALARDQYPKILEFAKRVGITVSVFDGDTKQSERVEILDNPPQLVITNFDVLHYHLWHRTRFASLLNSVKFLITDEVHVYSGIFGSNVHYIIKRLKRICNKIQFIASSATLPVNRLVQRIGRAARKGQRGYAFLALGNDPISQYYKNHPDDYFDDVERIYIDPKNPFVEEFQVIAMASDKPIAKHELREHASVIEKHVTDGTLVLHENRYVPNYEKVKTLLNEYSIRGIGKSIDIFFNDRKLGDRVLPIALEELHESAIYFLAGTRYKVKEFGYPEKNYAKLERIPQDYPYYTKALTEEWPTIEKIFEKRNAFGIEVAFCKLHIQKRVYGYANIEFGQEVIQGKKVLLDRPLDYDFITKGIVFHAPRPLKEIERSEDEEYVEASGYHATEHVVIEGSNMITGGVSQDLGGISLGTSGLIFIYDGAIGGNGASKALYDRFEKALERSMHIVKECPCKNEAGCPRCTFSYRCGNNNEFLHKHSSLEILQRINDGEQTVLEEPREGDRPLV